MILAYYGSYVSLCILNDEIINSRINLLMTNSNGINIQISSYLQYLIVFQAQPALMAFFLFTFAAATVVLLFFLYQLQMVAFGYTTNESFKWDDLKAAVKGGSVKWSRNLMVYNRDYKRGKTIVDPYNEQDMITIDKISDIRNIYNQGLVANLGEIINPVDLNEESKCD